MSIHLGHSAQTIHFEFISIIFNFSLHFLGRNFDYDSALTIVQDEEYLEDVDFDDIRRLRRSDVDYYEIYKKIGSFDQNFNVPKSEQKIDSWNQSPQEKTFTPRMLKKRTGRPVSIRNDRPNYR